MKAKLKTRNIRQRVNIARYIAAPERRVRQMQRDRAGPAYWPGFNGSTLRASRAFVFYCINQRAGRA